MIVILRMFLAIIDYATVSAQATQRYGSRGPVTCSTLDREKQLAGAIV